jgi:SAM-dependent methyltransferase
VDAREFYDGLGEDYDRMVSWEVRLQREEVFFQELFAAEGIRSVLDAACGTGMHAVAFARRGLRSAGADLSPAMVAQARLNAERARVPVELAAAGFGKLAAAFPGPFDAVTCLGNSLPHLLDEAALRDCLTDFALLLRPGGTLVIQNRNYDRLLRERQRFMPVSARAAPEGETLFLRITDFPGAGAAPGSPEAETVEFTIVTLRKRGGSWSQSVQTTPLRALRGFTLQGSLTAAGFSRIRMYGGYGREPWDPTTAADLVVVARKGSA